MNVKKLSLLLGLTVLMASSVTYASIPLTTPAGSSTDTVNRGYVALKWSLGGSFTPEAVVGFRHARVDDNGDTDGEDISYSFNLIGGFQAGKLRAKYFNGNENAQGELGGGYDFANGIFAGVGIKAPYLTIGVDYQYLKDTPWLPYFMVDTIDKYDKPEKTCPTNTKLIGKTCQLVP